MNQPPYFPTAEAPFALLREMAETPALIRGFDPACMAPWRTALAQKNGLFITGEGSSRIFPAKNAIDRARALQSPLRLATEGARQAAEFLHNDEMVIGLSNSGRTRETVHFLEALRTQGIKTYAICTDADSPLPRTASESRILTCGVEAAVAASKSVVEQALLLQALLSGPEWAQLDTAADAAAAVLANPAAIPLAASLAEAQTIYVAGRNNGVAEEIALKSCEITRRKSFYLEGTYILHGIEEIMLSDECVLLVDPFAAEIERYQAVLNKGVGIRVVAISAEKTPFPTLQIPQLAGFDNYLQLMAGWTLLAMAGQLRGIDIDKTIRARKVGNAVS